MRKPGAILAAVALVLPACGTANQDAIDAAGVACPPDSDCYDEVRPVGPGDELAMTAGDLFFEYEGTRSDKDDPSALTVQVVEGDLAVTLENIGAGVHNFRVDEAVAEAEAGKKVEAAGGATETGVLPLFAGSYTFYCDITGHRAAGMVGTVEVLTTAAAEEAGEAEAEDGEVDDEASPADEESPSDDASPTEDASPSEDPSPTEDASPAAA